MRKKGFNMIIFDATISRISIFVSFVDLPLSHSLTHSLTHSVSLPLSPSLSLSLSLSFALSGSHLVEVNYAQCDMSFWSVCWFVLFFPDRNRRTLAGNHCFDHQMCNFLQLVLLKFKEWDGTPIWVPLWYSVSALSVWWFGATNWTDLLFSSS